MKKVEAEIVGHMVRFLPRKELNRDGATIILHPKIGQWVFVCLNGEANTWHTFMVGSESWDKKDNPTPNDKEEVAKKLQVKYPRFSTVSVKEYTDTDGKTRCTIE